MPGRLATSAGCPGTSFLGGSIMFTFAKPLAAFAIVASFAVSAGYAAVKYQVTGTVVKLTDKIITVQKANDEKWEIDRDANTKVKGDLKEGAKVTIEYTMTAATVEVKAEKK
jgi:hypothetical protein